MSKRDFFRIIIKIFGVYFVIQLIFWFIPANITMLAYESLSMVLIWIVGMSLATLGVFILLVKNADRVIDWLKLDQGFDDDTIHIGNLNSFKLVSLATIIIGGLLIVDYLPSIFYNVYVIFKENAKSSGLFDLTRIFQDRVDYFDASIAVVNVLLGYLLISNYGRVALWLCKSNKEIIE